MLSLPRSHRRAARLYRAAHFSSIAPPTPKNIIFAAYIHCAAVTWANKTIFSRFWKIDYFCKQTFTNTVNQCVLHFYAKQVNFYCRSANKQTIDFYMFLPKSDTFFVDFTVFLRKIRVFDICKIIARFLWKLYKIVILQKTTYFLHKKACALWITCGKCGQLCGKRWISTKKRHFSRVWRPCYVHNLVVSR